MSSLTDSRLVELAVEHHFLNQDSAERLESEALQLSLPVETLAVRAGVLAGWQIEAMKILDQPEDLIPGYLVNGVLGRGGFGSVFRATQLNMSRDVALKTIPLYKARDQSAAKRFQREALIIGQLRHPHIVAAYNFGFHEDRLFLALELVEGNDVSKVLDQVQKFDEIAAWYIIRQTVSALAYAAELGVTHRDIKPANLLVAKRPIGYSLPPQVPFIKVSDFGLACFTQTRGEEGITLDNAGLGTPAYVAPEQLEGGDVDIRADIYSLGATAVHLISGLTPYSKLLPMEIAKKKLRGEEDWQDDLGDDFTQASKDLIRKMSAVDPDDRFADHETLLKTVDDLLLSMSGKMDLDTLNLTGVAELAASADTVSQSNLAPNQITRDSREFDDFELNISGRETITDHESANQSDHEHPAGNRNRNRIGVRILAASALLALMLAAWFLAQVFWTSETNPSVRFQLDASSTVRSFNGLRVDYSKFRLRQGKWAMEDDSEGGKVLAGTNCRVEFPCSDAQRQPLETFRFSIGVDVSESLDAKIELLRDGSELSDFYVSMNPEGVQIFRTVRGRDRELTKRMPWEIEPGSNTGYSRIAIDRQPDFWFVYRDSSLVGKVPCQDLEPIYASVEVVGKTLFESPEVTKLIAVETLPNNNPT